MYYTSVDSSVKVVACSCHKILSYDEAEASRNDQFTCPRCGHTGEHTSEFRIGYGTEIVAQATRSDGTVEWEVATVEGVIPSPEGILIQFTGLSRVQVPLEYFEVVGEWIAHLEISDSLGK